MSAADLLLSEGLTICASFGGGFRLLGVGSLPPGRQREVLAVAKEHREELKLWAKRHPPRLASGSAKDAPSTSATMFSSVASGMPFSMTPRWSRWYPNCDSNKTAPVPRRFGG